MIESHSLSKWFLSFLVLVMLGGTGYFFVLSLSSNPNDIIDLKERPNEPVIIEENRRIEAHVEKASINKTIVMENLCNPFVHP